MGIVMLGDDIHSGEERDRRQRVQSVEAATRLLDAFVTLGGTATLGRIATEVGMPPAKAHRYLASLKEAGYVEQADQSGHYRLGPAAMTLGLAALNQSDFIREADAHLVHIRDLLHVTCFAAVLGNRGPTVVRQAVAPQAVAVHVRLGSVLPFDRSATGLVFGAHLSSEQLRAFLDDASAAAVAGIYEEIRRAGRSAIQDSLMPGISAVAVPVHGYGRKLEGALTALGPTGSLDVSPDGKITHMLLEAAAKIGIALGAEAHDS